jgi:large subunit ribosomal protein L9
MVLLLRLQRKVSTTGVTYGSVNVSTVADELSKKGIEVDRKIITMHDIKKVGEFEATVHFYKDVEVKIPVTVVDENAKVVKAPVEEAPKAEEAPAAE